MLPSSSVLPKAQSHARARAPQGAPGRGCVESGHTRRLLRSFPHRVGGSRRMRFRRRLTRVATWSPPSYGRTSSCETARRCGYVRPHAAMLGVFRDTGFEVTRRALDGVVEVEFALTSSPEVLDRIARRDHSAVAASLTPFFQPHSIAVIGASARRGTIGGELFRNVIA